MSDSSPSVSLLLLFKYLLVLHGVNQAAQSDWQTLAASARPHDRVWLQEKLQQDQLCSTLRQYVKDAGGAFRKKSCQRFLHISTTGSSVPSGALVLQNMKYMS